MRIAFYYQAGMVFTDGSFEGEGVGGSEASLILLARELAKMGHEVTIFNNCPEAGVFNGVRYEHFSVIRNGHAGRHERVRRMTKDQGLMTDFDVFVLFRCYQDLILRTMRGPVKVFWSCDLYENSGWTRNVVPYVDGIVAISGFHAEHLRAQHGVPAELIHALDLGINRDDYGAEVAKVPGKLLYCSVPNRGLKYLAALYPCIRAQVPEAELFITSDYRLWGMKAGSEPYARMFEDTEGVHFLGKVSRAELVRHQVSAQLMVYPCDWPENFCIAAMECLAAGTVPVTSDLGALGTTVADCGVRIRGRPDEAEYQQQFVAETVRLLRDDGHRRSFAERGRRRALEQYGWEEVAKKQWEAFFEGVRGRGLGSRVQRSEVRDQGAGVSDDGAIDKQSAPLEPRTNDQGQMTVQLRQHDWSHRDDH